MLDRGIKKPLKTTDQLVSKIYSDTARCLKEDSAESKEELTDFEVVDREVGSFIASHFVASFFHIKSWNEIARSDHRNCHKSITQ